MMAQPVILKWPNEWAVAFLIGLVIGSKLVYDDVIHLQEAATHDSNGRAPPVYPAPAPARGRRRP